MIRAPLRSAYHRVADLPILGPVARRVATMLRAMPEAPCAARSPAALALRDVPAPHGVFLGEHRVLTQTKRGVRLILDTRDIIMTPIVLLNGEWEPETSRVLLDILRPGMNFVDVGANMGYFTSLAGLAVRGGGQVWAFEPDPVSYEFLADNVALNWLFENMRLERKGVYSRSTTLTLFRREKYVGNTSLGEVEADDLERTMDRQTPHQVEVVSLDDYFLPGGQRIDLMKIDVEGAEPHVIQGMAGLLRAQPGMRLMIEWSPGQIRHTMKLDPAPMMRVLQEHGFRAHFIGTRLEPVDLGAFDRIPHGMLLLDRDA
ncbi:FkbM family methyltransferase [Falsiroseomonas sp.]|uniref:FkbM family methyltransferase n=1 Tax=Falsiroseomonas sp. TaxID=2870721 RepID=UPI0034A3C41A